MALSGRTLRMRGAAGVLALGVVLAALAGCGEKKPPSAKPEPKTETKETMPEVSGLKEAGLDEGDPGSIEVMVKGEYDRGQKETYIWDPKYPAGTLKGGCRFVKKKVMTFPPRDVIDPTGENAVKNPLPKEVEYYRTIQVTRENYMVRLGRAKHGYTYIPFNVVFMLRNIQVGRRRPLNRPVMMIREGVIRPGSDTNYGGNNVQFSPTHERAQFTTWDAFPSEIVVSRPQTKEVLFKHTVRYVQAEDKKDKGHSTGHLAYKPDVITTPIIRETGKYLVSDVRHPWIRGHLIVADNPYVTVTTCHKYRTLCNFALSGVPPGKHTLEVWHPLYEPVKRTIEVEIEANKTTEVMVEFHPPE